MSDELNKAEDSPKGEETPKEEGPSKEDATPKDESQKAGDNVSFVEKAAAPKPVVLSPKEAAILKLDEIVERSFLGCVAVMVDSASNIDYSDIDSIATFIRSTPEIVKSCVNQSYAGYLLDNDLTDGQAINDLFSGAIPYLDRVFDGIQKVSDDCLDQYLSALRELKNKLDSEHSARAARLQEECDNANSGSIIVPSNFAGFMAMETFERTANSNILNTEVAISNHLAACQDEYDRYTYNLARTKVSSFFLDIMPKMAEIFYFGYFNGLSKVLNLESDDFFLPKKYQEKLSLYVTSKRFDELKKNLNDYHAEHPCVLGMIGSYGSLKNELEAWNNLKMPSVIAALYESDSNLFYDIQNEEVFDDRDNKKKAEYLDFAINDKRCASIFRSYLLLADSPTGYTGEEYPVFLEGLKALGWNDPLLQSHYSPEESKSLLRDNYYSTMVGKTNRLSEQGLYHYYETDHYWRCQCGSFNVNELDHCLLCGKAKSEVKTIETDPTYVSPVAVARIKSSPAYKNKETAKIAAIVFIPLLFIISLTMISGVKVIVDEVLPANSYHSNTIYVSKESRAFDSLSSSVGERFAVAMVFFGLLTLLTFIFAIWEKKSQAESKKRPLVFLALEGLCVILGSVFFALAIENVGSDDPSFSKITNVYGYNGNGTGIVVMFVIFSLISAIYTIVKAVKDS